MWRRVLETLLVLKCIQILLVLTGRVVLQPPKGSDAYEPAEGESEVPFPYHPMPFLRRVWYCRMHVTATHFLCTAIG